MDPPSSTAEVVVGIGLWRMEGCLLLLRRETTSPLYPPLLLLPPSCSSATSTPPPPSPPPTPRCSPTTPPRLAPAATTSLPSAPPSHRSSDRAAASSSSLPGPEAGVGAPCRPPPPLPPGSSSTSVHPLSPAPRCSTRPPPRGRGALGPRRRTRLPRWRGETARGAAQSRVRLGFFFRCKIPAQYFQFSDQSLAGVCGVRRPSRSPAAPAASSRAAGRASCRRWESHSASSPSQHSCCK